MIRLIHIGLCALLAALQMPLPADAQTSRVSSSSVVREAFAVRRFDDIQLPQATVRAVHVCRYGYLWAGTREGLVRYKSGQQHTFPQSTDGIAGLPSNMINVIHEDTDGNIWVGTDRGVAVKKPHTLEFRIIARSDEDRQEQLDIVYFAPMPDGLLAVSASGDLLRVTPGGSRYLRQRHDRSGGQHPTLAEARPVTAQEIGDRLYVGTMHNRLYKIAPDGMSFDIESVTKTDSTVIEMANTDGRLLHLERDSGLVWQSTGGGHERWDPLRDDRQGYYRAMAAHSPRSLWLAAGSSIVRIRGDQTDVVQLPGRGNEVRSITRDRSGNIWIGTYYGLYYGLDTDFNAMRTSATYDAGMVSAVAANSSRLFLGGQNIWAGTLDAKHYDELDSYFPADRTGGLRINTQFSGQNSVTALSATDELLLAGYFVGGLDIVDLRTGAVTNVTQDSPGGKRFDDVGISSLLELGDNRWLATLYMYGLAEIHVIPQASGPPRVSLRKLSDHPTLIGIYRIADSRYLAVGDKSLMVADVTADGSYRFRPFDSAPPGLIFAVAPDGLGGAYLGIENGGIRHLSSSMIERLDFAPDSVALTDRYIGQRTIWQLLLDSQDTLWATTNNGVYVFDLPRERLLSHKTYRDGLPSNEFEYGSSAFLKTPNGEKLFLSNQGPVIFDSPAQRQQQPIALNWASVTVDGESVADQITQSGQGNFRLELPFSAVSDSMLRLEYGFDDHIRALDSTYGWRPDTEGPWRTTGQPVLTISSARNWDPLSLDFVMLSSSEQVISTPLHLDIILTPPWYMLWRLDVRVVVPTLIAVGLLVLTLQLRARRAQLVAVRQAEQQRLIMEAEMRGRLSEKEILLREIHHRVGNILTNFAANVRSMQRSARSDETRDTLEHLNARIKVQSAVHMLLQRSDSTDINVANMIRQVVSGSRDFMGDRDPRPIQLELDDVYMTYSKAQYLGLIVNELLTNSYKYATGSSGDVFARVCLKAQQDGTARFEYRDYGPGPTQAEINRATARNRVREGGFQQVVALVRELKGEPAISSEGGMYLAFTLAAQLLHTPLNRDKTAPEA